MYILKYLKSLAISRSLLSNFFLNLFYQSCVLPPTFKLELAPLFPLESLRRLYSPPENASDFIIYITILDKIN